MCACVDILNELMGEGVSVHYHGLLQTGTPWADGTAMISECPIPPGGARSHIFKADVAGTFWYHRSVQSIPHAPFCCSCLRTLLQVKCDPVVIRHQALQILVYNTVHACMLLVVLFFALLSHSALCSCCLYGQLALIQLQFNVYTHTHTHAVIWLTR
jgi:Multicopper oxidase